MSRTNTRVLPNRLPDGSCGADGISGRVGLGGGRCGDRNSSFNGAGGFPDRPVGSKTGGAGGTDLRQNGGAGERSPYQEAATERETLKYPGPECAVSLAGDPVYRVTIHNQPPSSSCPVATKEYVAQRAVPTQSSSVGKVRHRHWVDEVVWETDTSSDSNARELISQPPGSDGSVSRPATTRLLNWPFNWAAQRCCKRCWTGSGRFGSVARVPLNMETGDWILTVPLEPN